MCGIAGYYQLDGMKPACESEGLAMCRALVHRGPDAGGLHLDGPVVLGNRRLRIIDVSGPDQPLFNEDRSIAVVMNGEIYNYAELRAVLEAAGHRLATSGDTECLIHLYEEFGIEGCLERLNGMFAFALWDRPRRRLVLARDRLGIKPLYLAESTGRLAFGSELKALLALPGFERRLDARALLDTLCLRYVPGDKAIFAGASKLPPASYLVAEAGNKPRIERYWKLAFRPVSESSVDDLIDELAVRLERAVERRLIAEVPLGAFLSGGLDSSTVTALMARQGAGSGEKPLAITVGFERSRVDERPAARQLAAYLGVRQIEEAVSPEAAARLDDLAVAFDEPFCDSSALPTYLLCEAARRHVTVVLSGDGGDENFAGYRRYRYDLLENRIRALVPRPVRRILFGVLGRIWPKADFLPRALRAKTLLGNLALDPLEAYLGSVAQLDARAARALMAPDLRREVADYRPREHLESIYHGVEADDPLSRVIGLDFETWLPDDILTKVDRASMAHSLEARVPVLDHELVETAARLPWNLKMRGGEGKWIFKRLVERWLPEEVLRRPKQGFHLPVAGWLRSELTGLVEEASCCPLLDPPAVLEALRQHLTGRYDRTAALWSVIMVDRWHRRWGAGPAAVPGRREHRTVHTTGGAR